MKSFLLMCCGTAVFLVLITSSQAMADVINKVQYRCYDETLRVSHGGWVSFYHQAVENCELAEQLYPNNTLYIQEDHY